MRIVTYIIILLVLSSCNDTIKFDSEKWNKKGLDWQMTDAREKMVKDLVKSDTLIGLSQEELFKLLGKPEVEKEFKFEYLVREKYEKDIDPDYIKFLFIELDEERKVKKYFVKVK